MASAKKETHPVCMYHADYPDGKLFDSDAIPKEAVDTPAKIKQVAAKKRGRPAKAK